MGPLLVLVSPCFRENEVFTCKSGIFCVVYIICLKKQKQKQKQKQKRP